MQVQQTFVQEKRVVASAILTCIYCNEIPEFVEGHLQQLYGHIRSSLPYLRIFGSTEQISTYVATQGATPIAVLIFRVEGRSIRVLNEMIHISADELHRFAACVFQRFPDASLIRFKSIHVSLPHFPYPIQCGPAEEDVVVSLPATPEEYMASLGKKTRPRIKQQLAKLQRDFPSFHFQTYEKEDIDEQVFYKLINLKGESIKTKKRQFSIGDDRARQLMALARECGVVCVIWIDGQLAAGKIDFRLGTNQVGEVTYNDPRYNPYSLGMVCNFLDISDSITKGIRKFHLGIGQNPYKLQLLGVPEQFRQVNLYRSSAHMMRSWGWVTKMWGDMQASKLKTWLNNHQDSAIARSISILLRMRHPLREVWARKVKAALAVDFCQLAYDFHASWQWWPNLG